jgi:hypothetical protein
MWHITTPLGRSGNGLPDCSGDADSAVSMYTEWIDIGQTPGIPRWWHLAGVQLGSRLSPAVRGSASVA